MADQTLIISVTGGYNGGAVIQAKLDGTVVYQATGDSPYNLNYTPSSGTFSTVAGDITITPSIANTTSPLLLQFTGAITETQQVMPQGANSSYGYNYSNTIFAGWALSASGPVVYQDGAEVINLAAADETITLYAVWERPELKCKLQYNKSENNKAVKDIEDLREFTFKLKDPTSIIDPVLLITGEITDMLQANYMTIPVFGRSYFITNITSVRTGLVEISAHVDVLSSYIEYIRECTAIVHRQENKWNLYLDDGFFKTYQNPNIVVKKFPTGFTNQSFVLAVAGN